MSRTARLDLRSFQQELATRLARKTAAQVESSRLAKPWFLGLANIRGNLFSVIDFAGFLGGAGGTAGGAARLILLNARSGEISAGIIVERVLGLRNLAQFSSAPRDANAPSWFVERWLDAEGNAWQEIDLGALARDATFLQVGA
jgi:twitching motility protein PilI